VAAWRDCSAQKVDKFSAFGLSTSYVKAPLVGQCYASLQCKVVDGKMAARYNLFIFEVLKTWIDPSRNEPRTIRHLGGKRSGSGQDDQTALKNEIVPAETNGKTGKVAVSVCDPCLDHRDGSEGLPQTQSFPDKSSQVLSADTNDRLRAAFRSNPPSLQASDSLRIQVSRQGISPP
jgi:hypothetical protein